MNNSITKVNIQQVEELITKLKSVSTTVHNNIKEYEKNLKTIENAGYLAGVAEISINLSCNKISKTCTEFKEYATKLANSLSEVTEQTARIESTEKNNIDEIMSFDPTKFAGIIGAGTLGVLGATGSGSLKEILDPKTKYFGSLTNHKSSNATDVLNAQIDKVVNKKPMAPGAGTIAKEDKTTTVENNKTTTSTEKAPATVENSKTTTTEKAPATVENNKTTTNSNNNTIDTSVYTNKPEKGFVVTTDNKTYNLTNEDRQLLYKIVASEAQKDSYDDALAVTSVVLNRSDTASSDPIAVATANNQFEGYYSGSYKTATVTPQVKKAVDDGLAGVRNNDYMYFASNGSNPSKYGNNLISSGGNRYRSNL